MSAGWMHIDTAVLAHLLNLPEGAKTLKAEGSEQGRKVGILVEHPDIPPEADWVSAIYTKDERGVTNFKEWRIVENGSAVRK